MYKCKKCKKQIEKKIPQSKIKHYGEDGQIVSEEKVCFNCKELNSQSTSNK